MAGKKGKSGRKPKSLETAHTNLSIGEAGSDAAEYIKKIVKGEEGIKVDPVRLDSCWKVIYQLLGKPPQRIQQDIEAEIHANVTGDIIAEAFREFEREGEG